MKALAEAFDCSAEELTSIPAEANMSLSKREPEMLKTEQFCSWMTNGDLRPGNRVCTGTQEGPQKLRAFLIDAALLAPSSSHSLRNSLSRN